MNASGEERGFFMEATMRGSQWGENHVGHCGHTADASGHKVVSLEYLTEGSTLFSLAGDWSSVRPSKKFSPKAGPGWKNTAPDSGVVNFYPPVRLGHVMPEVPPCLLGTRL